MQTKKYPEEEMWKPITYRNICRNMYEASSYGRIRNILTGHIMAQCYSEKGYLMVALMVELPGGLHKQHTFKLHKIIADTFLEKPQYESSDKTPWTVDHIVGGAEGKKDCSIYNLRYLSDFENKRRTTTDGQRVIIKGEQIGTSIITSDIARYIKLALRDGLTAPQIMRNIYDKFNISISKYVVYDIRRNKTWKHIEI